MKHNTLLFIGILILTSCANKKEQGATYWISGFKVSCDAGAGKSDCLVVNKGDELKADSWELFYADIAGFEFREGYLKKVVVLEEELQDEPLAADASKIKYTLVRELEARPDPRVALAVNWQLEQLNGVIVNEKITAPVLTFNLPDMQIHGNAGCNTYTGTIKKLGLKSMEFGELLNTLKMCAEDTIEDEYLNALGKVTSFEIDSLGLKLYDKEEQTVLIFKAYTKTDNKVRIHDIWSAVRIGGYPINRMVTVPRLEINTRDMKIYGNDGCNEYFGSILELTDNHMSIGAVGSTRKMCPDMETPQRYIDALSKVKSYVFEKDILILRDEEGKEVLAFMKSD